MATAYELAERLASEREAVQLAIVEHCPVPVFVADNTGRWLSTNLPMQRLLGSDEADLRNDGWMTVIDPLRVHNVLAEWRGIFETRSPKYKMVIHFKTPDGRSFVSYTSLIRLTNQNYIGFSVPSCVHPVDCPVHGFLLHNIDLDKSSNPSSGPESPRKHGGSKGAEGV